VGSLFNTDRLFVHERCKRLRDEIAGYAWDTKAAERGEDVPIKRDDHAVDPLRYVLQSVGVAAFGVRIFFPERPRHWRDREEDPRSWDQW